MVQASGVAKSCAGIFDHLGENFTTVLTIGEVEEEIATVKAHGGLRNAFDKGNGPTMKQDLGLDKAGEDSNKLGVLDR